MTITKVFVVSRAMAPSFLASLKEEKQEACWITIANTRGKPLVRGSSKDVLSLMFDDDSVSFSANQARKTKNFIANHHKNSSRNKVLVVNCVAGISRSAAIGKFCEISLGIPSVYTQVIHPNIHVANRLGGNHLTFRL
jgi:predicted protein tyrosine phosphatase